jgi:hypothetical protein
VRCITPTTYATSATDQTIQTRRVDAAGPALVDGPFVATPFLDVPFLDVPFLDVPFLDVPFLDVVDAAAAGDPLCEPTEVHGA